MVRQSLAQKDPETAEIVNLHYFGGLTWVEISEVTGKSERDLQRQWTFARAWLREEISTSAHAGAARRAAP